ncbi:Uncharacterised protein [Staphylococcus aureus]|nr:Uncharacterised protein [Staphylococcus aureus]
MDAAPFYYVFLQSPPMTRRHCYLRPNKKTVSQSRLFSTQYIHPLA